VAATAPRSGLTVGVVAGEASGDNLGAALIEALRERVPDVRVVGVAGPKMRAAGCEVLADADELALMGLTEILRHLPRLVALRRRVRDALLALRPDVFVGIDAPEFNLGLERQLKAAGLRTVQYVSPQVWAWRQGRVRTIGRSTDLVLCLLPFEPKFYADHGVRAQFVGHPLADQFPLEPDRDGARRELGFDARDTLVALLPGSRLGEVSRLGEDFAGAAAWIARQRPGTRFVAPMATPAVRARFERALASAAPAVDVTLLDGRARLALAAADVVLVASGTATLETLLSKRRWWWRTGSPRRRSSCCAASAWSRCSTSRSRTCCWGNAWCPSCCRRTCAPRRSGPPCSPSSTRRAVAASSSSAFSTSTGRCARAAPRAPRRRSWNSPAAIRDGG
jgi:lipid-A-disaccharide synthase